MGEVCGHKHPPSVCNLRHVALWGGIVPEHRCLVSPWHPWFPLVHQIMQRGSVWGMLVWLVDSSNEELCIKFQIAKVQLWRLWRANYWEDQRARTFAKKHRPSTSLSVCAPMECTDD
jgi:hypothetical protein